MVVGGGVGGLTTALALSRAGIATTLIERDDVPDVPDADAAFGDRRSGTPQARQTHGFLARLLVILRERFPDVLADLEAAGGSVVSMAGHLGEPRPGDADLGVLVVRRSTYEWMLRRRVRADRAVTMMTGVGVDGLVTDGTDPDDRPVVVGVRLDDRRTLRARAVVASTGVRGDVPGWLARIGVDCQQRSQSSGLTYLTRWYRVAPGGRDAPRVFAHLPYMRVLAVPGDGATLSVSLAVPLGDTELRRALSDPDAFDRACRALPATEHLFAPGAPSIDPLSGVEPMGGLLNRTRRFTDGAGRPTTVGFHAVGDAHTTTNPLLGRGCSLAALQAVRLADAFDRHPDDPVARAVAYEAACDAEVVPWFENATIMDALEAGRDPSGLGSPEAVAAARLVGAMFLVGPDDPTVGRALARYVNLLDLPTALLARDDLVARVAELAEARPAPGSTVAPQGPAREELLGHLRRGPVRR